MRPSPAVLALGLALVVAPAAAEACAVPRPFDPHWVKDADAVVAGRVTEHSRERVKVRAQEMRWVPTPDGQVQVPEELSLERETVTVDVAVDQVLMGEAPKQLRLDWPQQFVPGETGFAPGHYVIALKRGPSGRPDDERLVIYSSLCRGGHLYAPSGSARGMAFIRVLMGRDPEAPPPPKRPDPIAEPRGVHAAAPAPAPNPALEPSWGSLQFEEPEGWRRVPVLPVVLASGALGGVLVAAILLRRRKRK
ncbi:hypothetical protein [Brevundimonas sp. M20]|uniref:hypothetical protein n=1 Tax=Brevundimonas sp. M20 TaxID=2591463 RepID=UPI00114682B4|nr:hypothetical protein [Brevundimonas sp. M20]QDH73938.1 hypothetical protein FKQ52_11215 [Brevundimonas sp. M20]